MKPRRKPTKPRKPKIGTPQWWETLPGGDKEKIRQALRRMTIDRVIGRARKQGRVDDVLAWVLATLGDDSLRYLDAELGDSEQKAAVQ